MAVIDRQCLCVKLCRVHKVAGIAARPIKFGTCIEQRIGPVVLCKLFQKIFAAAEVVQLELIVEKDRNPAAATKRLIMRYTPPVKIARFISCAAQLSAFRPEWGRQFL